MDRDRDTTSGTGEGGIRLRLLDGGRIAAPLVDGGWRVGPGVGAAGAGGAGAGLGAADAGAPGQTAGFGAADAGAPGQTAGFGAADAGAPGQTAGFGAADAGGRSSGPGGDGTTRGRATGREMWGAEPPAECVVVRSAVRAGDRHEPWTLPATDALRALADDARAAGVDVELATRLTLECALVCDDLRAAGVDLSALDAAAATERVDGQLDAAAASYLRRLTGRRRDPAAATRRPAPPVRCADPGAARRSAGFAPDGDSAADRRDPLGEVVTVGLPVRLSARLLAADLDALLSAVPLDRALAWETAAVVAGRTMSEWAPLTALRRG